MHPKNGTTHIYTYARDRIHAHAHTHARTHVFTCTEAALNTPRKQDPFLLLPNINVNIFEISFGAGTRQINVVSLSGLVLEDGMCGGGGGESDAGFDRAG